MGTTFEITFLDSTGIDLMLPIQQLLIDINNAVSTYVDTSEISIFNQKDSLIVDNGGHFHRNYTNAQKIYAQTEGWFNPTVMPLVNYWGFGYTEKKMITKVDSSKIDSLLSLVAFETISSKTINTTTTYYKPTSNTGIQLDFSAIAKGDAVDEIGRLLEKNSISNYFVEIGGEIRTRGTTSSGFAWRTGIRQPQEKSSQTNLQMIVELKNKALATSGNYENYHEDPTTGQKYAHTINPQTGYPERNNLLSASVLTPECGTADAFATAFMAMGLETAWEIAIKNPDIEAYFIYVDEKGEIKEKMTEGIKAIRVD
jgi:thiamine biosynthesis lipoprotein